jgi:MoxR-like ATPase
VFDVAPEILRHRVLLSYDALASAVKVDDVISRVLQVTPAPRVAPHQHGAPGDTPVFVASAPATPMWAPQAERGATA